MNERQKIQLEKLKKIVESKNGICLFNIYDSYKTKLPFQCDKGHIWETTPNAIMNQGNWCPKCHILSFKLSDKERIEGFNIILKKIKEKNGKCLSKLEDYNNLRSILKLRCFNNHVWKTMAMVIKRGSWCPFCDKEKQRNKIEDIIKFIENKGGRLLTKRYLNNKQKLEVECHKKHIWFITYHNLSHGYWCPFCKQSLSEKLFRIILEKIFNCSFESCWPEWLRGEKRYKLQIDGYNKKLKLGFEYQGIQHFQFIPYFHKTIDKFKYRQQNDRIKEQIFKERNIFMLYPTYKLKKKNYLKFIQSKIKNTRYEDIANFNQNININKLYELL